LVPIKSILPPSIQALIPDSILPDTMRIGRDRDG